MPTRQVELADGSTATVATAFDLLMAQYGVPRGLGGDYPKDYDDEDAPYTPAWTERYTGIDRKDLLQFARDDRDHPQPTQIQEVLKRTLSLVGENFKRHGIAIHDDLPSDLPEVRARPHQLQQVFLNLLINAKDALKRDDGNEAREIRISGVVLAAASPPAVQLQVRDNDIGIRPGLLRRVFEPFVTTKRAYGGTGLGLSTVYGIVRQHGGWIYTLSTPRMGTTFEVYLPAAGAEPVASAAESQELAAGQEGSGERILVVEDEESVRDLAATILRKNGYEVFEAPNVAEALRIYEQEDGKFDLVFSDVVLPDRSGVQLADELLERAPDIRLLMSSGHASHRSQWETIKNKGLPFLQKPYSLPSLLQMVRRTIQSDQ